MPDDGESSSQDRSGRTVVLLKKDLPDWLEICGVFPVRNNVRVLSSQELTLEHLFEVFDLGVAPAVDCGRENVSKASTEIRPRELTRLIRISDNCERVGSCRDVLDNVVLDRVGVLELDGGPRSP